jgi:hypothetical protein
LNDNFDFQAFPSLSLLIQNKKIYIKSSTASVSQNLKSKSNQQLDGSGTGGLISNNDTFGLSASEANNLVNAQLVIELHSRKRDKSTLYGSSLLIGLPKLNCNRIHSLEKINEPKMNSFNANTAIGANSTSSSSSSSAAAQVAVAGAITTSNTASDEGSKIDKQSLLNQKRNLLHSNLFTRQLNNSINNSSRSVLPRESNKESPVNRSLISSKATAYGTVQATSTNRTTSPSASSPSSSSSSVVTVSKNATKDDNNSCQVASNGASSNINQSSYHNSGVQHYYLPHWSSIMMSPICERRRPSIETMNDASSAALPSLCKGAATLECASNDCSSNKDESNNCGSAINYTRSHLMLTPARTPSPSYTFSPLATATSSSVLNSSSSTPVTSPLMQPLSKQLQMQNFTIPSKIITEQRSNFKENNSLDNNDIKYYNIIECENSPNTNFLISQSPKVLMSNHQLMVDLCAHTQNQLKLSETNDTVKTSSNNNESNRNSSSGSAINISNNNKRKLSFKQANCTETSNKAVLDDISLQQHDNAVNECGNESNNSFEYNLELASRSKAKSFKIDDSIFNGQEEDPKRNMSALSMNSSSSSGISSMSSASTLTSTSSSSSNMLQSPNNSSSKLNSTGELSINNSTQDENFKENITFATSEIDSVAHRKASNIAQDNIQKETSVESHKENEGYVSINQYSTTDKSKQVNSSINSSSLNSDYENRLMNTNAATNYEEPCILTSNNSHSSTSNFSIAKTNFLNNSNNSNNNQNDNNTFSNGECAKPMKSSFKYNHRSNFPLSSSPVC